MKALFTLMFVFGSLGLQAQEAADCVTVEENPLLEQKSVAPPSVDLKGIASYYHDKFIGRQTANGEIFDNNRFTAASNNLKLGSYVKVTNLSNGEVIYVRINDRMAKSNTRVIDLTSLAAKKLQFHKKGITKVKIEVVPAEEGKKAILAQRKATDSPDNQL